MTERRRARDEHGAAAIVAALIALVSLTFAALCVDLGAAVARKGDTQAQADLAVLAAAENLPGTKVSSSPAVIAVRDYLNKNQPLDDDAGTCVRERSCVTAEQLVNNSDADGEVYFPTSATMRVVSPESRVNFGFAGVFGMFGGGVADHTDVASDATVMVGSPDGLGVFPMYIVQGGSDSACDYGLQTLTDPPSGHVEPPSVPTLYANGDTNGNELKDIDVTDGGVTATSVAVGSSGGRIVLSGKFKDATKVGFFRSDSTTTQPVEVAGTDPDWVSPLPTPYTQNSNGAITVNVPVTVTTADALWYVRVYQGGTGPDKLTWSARAEAQPLSIGDAPYECVGGSSDGNFGTVKVPRTSTPSSWIPENIALGVQAPLSLSLFPGAPPPSLCTTSPQPPAVFSSAGNLMPDTNCLDVDTGLTAQTATEGFIDGGTYGPGLLATGSSAADPDGSGGCNSAGTTAPVTVSGKQLNNDLLTCYLTDDTTTLGDVARRNYTGTVKFDPAIYESPRFGWVPVFGAQPTSGGSQRYSLVDFRPLFITDQPMTATRANRLTGSGPGMTNGLGLHGGKLATIKVVFLSVGALPDGQAQTPIGPYLGVGPKTTRLVD